MLKYTIIFLLSAIIAGVLGYGVMDGSAATVAKVLFFIALILFLGSLLYDPDRRRSEI